MANAWLIHRDSLPGEIIETSTGIALIHPGWEKRAIQIGALFLVVAFLVLNPWLRWPCPTARVFHLPCPSCGLTRAGSLLFHGDLTHALHMHPLVLLVLPYLAVFGVLEAGGYIADGRWGRFIDRTWGMRITKVVLGLGLLVWILRFFGMFGGPAPV